MNAAAIFNSIHHRDLWSLIRAYNDTTDGRRDWTFIGRLPETEKVLLRDMIRGVVMGDDRLILDVIDGTYTGVIPVPYGKDSNVLYSCYNYHTVYTKPWICGTHELRKQPLTTFNSMTHADYVVMLVDGDHDEYVGKKIFPSVAQIIIAEVVMGKMARVSMIWSQGRGKQQHDGITYDVEMGLRHHPGMISLVHPFNDMIEVSWKLAKYTPEDVTDYFLEINQLIHTRHIVNRYLSSSIHMVDGSISDIIDAIASTRYAPRDWMAHFDTIPDDYADVSITTP